MDWLFPLSLSHCFKKSLFEDVLTPLSIHDSVWTWGIYGSTHIFFRGQTIFQMSQTIRWMIHQEKKTTFCQSFYVRPCHYCRISVCRFCFSWTESASRHLSFHTDALRFTSWQFLVCSALVATLYRIILTYSPLLDVLEPSPQLLNLLAFVHLKNFLAAISLNVRPFW